MRLKVSIFHFWMVVILAAFASVAHAQEGKSILLVQVDGLSCPFCSYGLEKKLKQLEGVEKVEIHLKQGKAEIQMKPGSQLSEEEIHQAVEDAGFTPGPIEKIIVEPNQ